MKIFKFGGASVRDAAGIRNFESIVRRESGDLVVVVSAMGKTTNALEQVTDLAAKGETQSALDALSEVRAYHYNIIQELFPCGHQFLINKIEALLQQIAEVVRVASTFADYDELYDQIVSYGELISTRIVSYTLDRNGISNHWLDMPTLLRTDNTFREAKPDIELSSKLLRSHIKNNPCRVYIAQGFIGGTADGKRTTLGREGSDYTAALLAYMLDASSVTIWKDVPGILNADPRLVGNTELIPQLTYYDAVELSYSGAQIIHPKTIRPLENKHIPLYVRPFMQPDEAGSVIKDEAPKIEVPIYIWRKKQVLVTVRPKDFSFLLEEGLNKLFDVIHRHRLKVSLIQSSAVTISVCVDNSRYLEGALEELRENYRVSFNEGLSLLTIRNTTPQVIAESTMGKTILLSQTTRHTARYVIRE